MSAHNHPCVCPRCSLASARVDHPDKLPIFVVYDRPSDFPDHWVVRLWLTDAPTTRAWTFESLEQAREALPHGLLRVHRMDGDDPKIAETWF